MKKSIQKVLSVTAIAALLTMYSAPLGLCAAAVPQITTGIGVQKPVLRENPQMTSLKLEGDISISKANPKVTLSLRDSDVKQVLRMFADKAGLNIIFHSSVGGGASASADAASSGPKVTMDLVNVPLNDAFKMVLQVANLTYYLDGNTLIIADATAAQTLNLSKQELMTIPVKYIDAAATADFLNKNIFSLNRPGISNSNIAVTNPNSNEILIFGTKNDYAIAKKIIAQFDKKPLEETFIVNHTSPSEMSKLVCNLLFEKFYGASNTSGSSSSHSGSPGGTTPSGSGGSTTAGSAGDLSLGAGIVACQYNNGVSANQLSSLSGNSMAITYFAQKGTIMARGGSPQQIEMIKDFIQKTDKKQPQAYLEISIIELNESGSKAFNNTWDILSKDFSFKFDGQTTTNPNFPSFIKGDLLPTVPAVNQTIIDNFGVPHVVEISPATVLRQYTGDRTIAYTMNYLIKNGKGRVLANPRILITNGQTSKIDLVSDYISKVDATTTTTTASPVTTFTYNIASDNGIQVELTPYISPDGYVTLNIKPKYATIAEKITGAGLTAGLTVATLLNKRDLDLKNIRIKDGETLTIGGLINEAEQKTVAKFPVLGDLPGIGVFFRNTSSEKTRQELVIMITPKIVKDSEDVVSNPNMTL